MIQDAWEYPIFPTFFIRSAQSAKSVVKPQDAVSARRRYLPYTVIPPWRLSSEPVSAALDGSRLDDPFAGFLFQSQLPAGGIDVMAFF